MNRTLLSLALVASFVPAVALACDGETQNTQASIGPRETTVAQVAQWTKAKAAVPVDANGKQTRSSEGVIPGAVLLTSSSEYSLTELPTNKQSQLVFYCANEKCGASHQAARRAMEAGYTNVAVLPVGIKGWKAAGQPTSKPNPNS
jgi:rhodanese-related sulfurtransferase